MIDVNDNAADVVTGEIADVVIAALTQPADVVNAVDAVVVAPLRGRTRGGVA